MSTVAEMREAIAEVLKAPPSSLERRADGLQKDKLLPIGARGGGKGSAQCDSEHCVHFMLSLAAPRPGEAAKLVRALDALPFRGTNPAGHKSYGEHLGSALGAYLDVLARPLSAGLTLEPSSLAMVKSWQLSICLDPISAQITMDDGEGYITHYFVADKTPRSPLSHIIMFSGDLWLTFSKLLSDTYMQQNAVSMMQFLAATRPAKADPQQDFASIFPDPSRANAAPESNNAGHLRQEVPASIDNQPTPMGPEPRSPRKVSAKTKIFKDAPLAGLVTADK